MDKMELIDKVALVAEIEELMEKYSKCPTHINYEEGLKEGRLIGYKDALWKINSLEVKDVDLDKIVKEEYLKRRCYGGKNNIREKAQEIINKQWEWIADLIEKNNLSKEDRNQIMFKMYDACLDMAEWEKQQLIDKICEWIKEHNGDYISIVPNDHLTNNFYDDLRIAMEGE